MNYRRAKITDSKGISEVHKKAILITNKPFYTAQQLKDWLGQRTIDDYIDMIEKGNIFVAEDNEKIVGFSNLSLHDSRIKAVYVDPDYGKMGIGKNLLDLLIENAKANNITRLGLNSSEMAKDFYLKNGFKLIEKNEHKLKNGKTISGYAMEIDLLP